MFTYTFGHMLAAACAKYALCMYANILLLTDPLASVRGISGKSGMTGMQIKIGENDDAEVADNKDDEDDEVKHFKNSIKFLLNFPLLLISCWWWILNEERLSK